jgi:hypothetical protein
VVRNWEQVGRWGKAVPPAPQATEPKVLRITIQEAAEDFLAKCKNRLVAPNALAKYRSFTNQFEAHFQNHGYAYVDQLTPRDMDRFYASWKDGVRAKANKLERLKAFIKFCLKRKWLNEHIADDLQAPEGSSVTGPKSPFTDAELDRLNPACDEIGRNLSRDQATERGVARTPRTSFTCRSTQAFAYRTMLLSTSPKA